MLDSLKVMEATDIPVKVIKSNSNLFAKQICPYFNEYIDKRTFLNCSKLANITPIFRNGARTSKNN